MSFEMEALSTSALKHGILPEIFASAGSRAVRAWVPRCAAGQEAFGIAMLLNDYVELHGLNNDIRVFGTHNDFEQLLPARMGLFDGDLRIVKHEARLRRYLQPSEHGARVAKRIRDCLLFTKHDVLADPPFSNMNLILGDLAFEGAPPAKLGELVQILHYALSSGGFLLLNAELAPPEMASYFRLVEEGVYRARTDRPSLLPASRRRATRRNQPREVGETRRPPRAVVSASVERLLLQQYVPPCLVVSDQGYIIHSTGKTGRYLQNPDGPPTNRLVDMLRPELRAIVPPLLELPVDEHGRLTERNLLELDGARVELQIFVHTITELEPERRLRALVFREIRAEAPAKVADPDAQELRDELELLRANAAQLQEEYRTSAEELTASNDELSSLNEELEASNDELSTTKDQLLSVNEELETVNGELKLKLEELGQAHEETRNLFESTQVATLFLDDELRIGRFTPAAQDLFGLIAADRGRPLGDIAQKFRYEQLLRDAMTVMRSGRPMEAQVQSFSRRWYVLRMLPFVSAEPDKAGVVLAFSDVTVLKLAELEVDRLRLALESQLLWLRMLVDVVPVGLGYYDPGEKRLNLNRAAIELVGVPPDSAGDPGPLGFAWPPEFECSLEQAKIRELMTSGTRVDGSEVQLTTDSGEARHLVLHAASLAGEDGAPSATVSGLLDATESVEQREALQAAELRESQAASQRELDRHMRRTERLTSLGTFATGIAHELNNPLSNIALSADYALTTPDPERRAKLLDNVRENARRCGRIVESVLNFARDEATPRWPNELHPLVQRAVELVGAYPRCENLRIVLHLAEPGPRVDCNQTEIEQVFVNLFKNAAQANPDHCLVEVRSEIHDGRVKVTVADDGQGIPESSRERVFDPFFSTQRAFGGTGLGLSITHRIVATHGGAIRVANAPGLGAVFEIELPLSTR